MTRFSTFLEARKHGYPGWARAGSGALAIKIRNLEKQIKTEDDFKKGQELISTQIKLSSYLTLMSLAINTKDKRTASRIRSAIKSRSQKNRSYSLQRSPAYKK